MKDEKAEYLQYLEQKSPNSPVIKNTALAFVYGGTICTVGQMLLECYSMVLEQDAARSAVSVTMIFLGALLTGLNLYPKMAKYAGAGTIVPITGFANAIVAPAMEFRKEGLILGLASKMFVIAGPVLVYGITASAVVGLVYYLIGMIGG